RSRARRAARSRRRWRAARRPRSSRGTRRARARAARRASAWAEGARASPVRESVQPCRAMEVSGVTTVALDLSRPKAARAVKVERDPLVRRFVLAALILA